GEGEGKPKGGKAGAAAGKDDGPPKGPGTHKVEKKPFKVQLTVKGTLEPEAKVEIAHRPHPTVGLPVSPGPLKIQKAAEHGATVRKGDLLVAFDTQQIDQAIAQLEGEKRLLEANVKLNEEEVPVLRRSAPVELAAAEEAKKRADEDLKYFRDIGRPQAEQRANFYVKGEEFFLEFEREQLRQLEKMYKAHDLTEDTEQIILKRQRFYVEMAVYFVKQAHIQRDYVLKVDLPRKEKTLTEGVAKQTVLLEKAQKTLTPQVEQREQALAKMGRDLAKIRDGLERLRKDRAAMTVNAPEDGVVFHGKFAKGQW